MAVKINLECGHVSVLRVRTTPEGYTHDWEVFVRGVDNADISHYVEKVVFQLHVDFPKPKRIIKDPPFVVKESGYAGFEIPISIFLKNKDEPKRIQFKYDLHLQQSGPALNNIMRHSEVFVNPCDDFRKKLLKGGGIVISNPKEGHDKSETKLAIPMVGKPKLSGSDTKKHRTSDKNINYDDLFRDPIKVSSESKKNINDKNSYQKVTSEKVEKTEKLSKTKHSSAHKDSKREKNSEEKKDKKDKDLSKEKERSRDKSKRPLSPIVKSSHQSPTAKRPVSPISQKKPACPADSHQKSTSPKIREKDHKKVIPDKEKEKDKDRDKEKTKESSKNISDDIKTDKKRKKHKDDKNIDKKDRIRDKDRDKVKEIKTIEKKTLEKLDRHEKSDKDKSQDVIKSSKDGKKSPKLSKDTSERNNSKNRSEKPEEKIVKDSRSEKDRQKHKHKKKEKKERLDDSRERDKRDKRDKQKNNYEKDLNTNYGSSISASANPLASQANYRDSSDSANSGDEEDSKPPVPQQQQQPEVSCKVEHEVSRNMVADSRLSRPLSPTGSEPVKREKPEKARKDKSKPIRGGEERDGKKRKRRSDSKGTDDEIAVKRLKESGFSPPLEPVSSSQSPVIVESLSCYTSNEPSEAMDVDGKPQDFETESEQIAPDSTNSILVESESDEPLVFSDDYVSQLKDLQQKIMTLQDNHELQKVVQVIAATGQYEITRKTFDFDLCTLDRTTVQRLQQLFLTS